MLEVRCVVESSKRLINFRCAETNIDIGQTFEAVQESCCEFSVKSPSLVRRNIVPRSIAIAYAIRINREIVPS